MNPTTIIPQRLYVVEFEDGSEQHVVAHSVGGALAPFECFQSSAGRIVEVTEVAENVLFGN